MAATHRGPLPNSLVRELVQPALPAAGASYGRVYFTTGGDGAISLAEAWGEGLPNDEGNRLAQQVVLARQIVAMPAPSSNAGPGRGTTVGVPLEIEGQVRGALLVGFPSGQKDHCECDRMGQAILQARLVAAYLWCTELKETLAQREQHLDQLMRSAIESQEAEREWIYLEIHDGMTQTLASAFQHLEAYKAIPASRLNEAWPHILRAAALVRQAIGECRNVINSMTPGLLSELGLVTALRQELRQFEEDTGCSVQFNAPEIRLPRYMEVTLYRIVHEAVTNVRKHARAKSLEVGIHQERGRVSVRVKDLGVGFDSSRHLGRAPGQGLGLWSMRKRAEILGGVCEIKSQPGQGTEVIVDVPLFPETGRDKEDQDSAGGRPPATGGTWGR